MAYYDARWDAETKAYFQSLPKLVQENILQNGLHIERLEDLQAYTKNVICDRTDGKKELI